MKWVLMALSMTGICGCGHLSRSHAREEIRKSAMGREGRNLYPKIGKISRSCSDQSLFSPPVGDLYDRTLSRLGYLTIEPVGKNIWNVRLTADGDRLTAHEKYAHEEKADCDEWQTTFPISKLEDIAVVGILEDGARAKAEALLSYSVTPLGLSVRKLVPELCVKAVGKGLSAADIDDTCEPYLERIFGREWLREPIDAQQYSVVDSILFEKYDDGWRLSR
jgi:hypothetical protein